MILANIPTDGPGLSAEDKRSENKPPLPFYRRSPFWMILGLLAGILILFLLHSCQKAEEPTPPVSAPAPETAQPQSQEDKDAPYRDLLELQQAQNRGLEEEIRRLQQLLREDPCELPAILGSPPGQTPVSPGYAQAEGTPKAVPPQANGTVAAAPSDDGASRAPDSSPDGSMPAIPHSQQQGPLAQAPHGSAAAPHAEEAPSPSQDGGQPRPPADKAPHAAPKALPSPETVGDLLDKATVFILSQHEGQTGLGSGFFVAPGIIATNSHVIQAPDAMVIVGNKALGGMQRAAVIAFSREQKRDYALLKIDDALAAKAPVLMLAPGAKRMEKVSAWGFPGYIAEIDPKLRALIQGDSKAAPEVVYSEGVVSVVLERTPPVILHTASISQGNSGGPLVNSQGVAVGINTFIKKANKSYSQTNIALTGEDLAKFILEQGIQATMVNQ